MDVTNEMRAGWARAGLEAFGVETGQTGYFDTEVGDDDASALAAELRNEQVSELVSDFLCDLMHLCDVEGVDFAALLERGRGHYAEEAEEAADASGEVPVYCFAAGCRETAVVMRRDGQPPACTAHADVASSFRSVRVDLDARSAHEIMAGWGDGVLVSVEWVSGEEGAEVAETVGVLHEPESSGGAVHLRGVGPGTPHSMSFPDRLVRTVRLVSPAVDSEGN